MDTLEPFLFVCPREQTFWSGITQWLATEANNYIKVTNEEYLFGLPTTTQNSRIINAMTLYAKFYTYRQNFFHYEDLSVIHFLRELRIKLHTEAFLCNLKNKARKSKGWNLFFNSISNKESILKAGQLAVLLL